MTDFKIFQVDEDYDDTPLFFRIAKGAEGTRTIEGLTHTGSWVIPLFPMNEAEFIELYDDAPSSTVREINEVELAEGVVQAGYDV